MEIVLSNWSMPFVIKACKGFCNVYLSRITLVPKNEAPHLLSVQNKTFKVSVGTWVRMKAGIYKGDLAKVFNIGKHKQVGLIHTSSATILILFVVYR